MGIYKLKEKDFQECKYLLMCYIRKLRTEQALARIGINLDNSIGVGLIESIIDVILDYEDLHNINFNKVYIEVSKRHPEYSPILVKNYIRAILEFPRISYSISLNDFISNHELFLLLIVKEIQIALLRDEEIASEIVSEIIRRRP